MSLKVPLSHSKHLLSLIRGTGEVTESARDRVPAFGAFTGWWLGKTSITPRFVHFATSYCGSQPTSALLHWNTACFSECSGSPVREYGSSGPSDFPETNRNHLREDGDEWKLDWRESWASLYLVLRPFKRMNHEVSLRKTMKMFIDSDL